MSELTIEPKKITAKPDGSVTALGGTVEPKPPAPVKPPAKATEYKYTLWVTDCKQKVSIVLSPDKNGKFSLQNPNIDLDKAADWNFYLEVDGPGLTPGFSTVVILVGPKHTDMKKSGKIRDIKRKKREELKKAIEKETDDNKKKALKEELEKYEKEFAPELGPPEDKETSKDKDEKKDKDAGGTKDKDAK